MATILYVDDYKPVLLLVEDILRTKGGHEVLTAEDGQAGYKLALSQRPDLLLIDLGMPRMSGGELISKLLRTPEFRRVPMVIVTSYSGYDWTPPFDLPLAGKPINSRYLPKGVDWLLGWAASQPPAEPSDDPATYPFYRSRMSDKVRAAGKNLL